MKKYIRTAALLGAMCFALMPTAPAYAANWVYVTKSTNNAVWYYDSETTQRSGNQVTAWVKVDFSRVKTEKARESKFRVRYDCGERTSTLLNETTYYPDGKIDTFTWRTYEQEEDAVTPDTTNETLLAAVCKEN
jgi:hypothetical protein